MPIVTVLRERLGVRRTGLAKNAWTFVCTKDPFQGMPVDWALCTWPRPPWKYRLDARRAAAIRIDEVARVWAQKRARDSSSRRALRERIRSATGTPEKL